MSYEVVGVLGRGGSALVELALDDSGRWVATKRVALTGSAAQMGVARQRLRREAEVVKSLAHPGIVPILDVIEEGSDVLLVFPAWFENLEDRVARLGPLPATEVIRIGRVLLAALATAHRHGVVHRDIKPANVLFNAEGEPALSDFGVAVTRDVTAGLTPDGAVVGTPLWMAPEQANGESPGPASDVFSLGATLRFAATGEGPYASGPVTAVGPRAARRQIRPLPSGLPMVLRTQLARMLEPRPQRRPSAAGVLGGLDGTAVTPRPQGGRRSMTAALRHALAPGEARLGRAGHPRGRRRYLTAAAAVGGASAVAAAIFLGIVAARPLSGRPALAPHSNGKACDPGWYNLTGIPAAGCLARSDYVAGTRLTAGAPVHANLVPASATDSFSTHVSGNALHFCWGSLHVTLTAPVHTAEQLSIWKGTTKVGQALSADGNPATATVAKPSCFGANSEELTVTVTAVAATGAASASDFNLTRDGGW
jgi:hypothetical protein